MDYKDLTIQSYDLHAGDFSDKFKKLMDFKRRPEFGHFIDLLNGKNILDLGCGSGDHSVFFKEKGLDVTSVDLSDGMIEICKKKGLRVLKMDIEVLDFSPNSFNGIWAVTSLLHVPKSKLKTVIERLSLILANLGIIYVCVKEGQGEGLIEDSDGKTSRFFSCWTEKEMKELFEDYFNLIEIEKFRVGKTTFLKAFFRKKS